MRSLATMLLSVLLVCTLAYSCRGGSTSESAEAADSIHSIPDTLRVGTLYSPLSYFIYREEQMGYDYDLIKQFGVDKGVYIDLVVAPSISSLLEMLDSGKVDLAAYEIPIIAANRDRVIPCGVENITHQVLVQPKGNPDSLITDVTQLVGREVYVEKDSKYQHRLANLNDELGGGIMMHVVDQDTLITEDLIEMVSSGKIPLTIVDSDIARLNKTYYNSLDVSLEVSFPQRSSWGVPIDKAWLADSINAWIDSSEPRQAQEKLLKRYFELSKNSPSLSLDLSKGRMSPYDNLFKKYAKDIGWDWRMLASQGYAESRFDTTVVSWAGARGLMQIMPRTARAYGLSMNRISNPEASISTATAIIRDLDKSLSRYVPDPEERKKFVVAAYNSGIAHIYDAIALARKYGKNPQVWSGNVAEALLMKANPDYYNDPVCKYGYFRGKETTNYVIKVFDMYNRARKKVPV